MSDTAVPAKAAQLMPAPARSTDAVDAPKKLDDVLMAMDVVDTLRHRERVVDTELDAEAREAQLIGRLKEIYTAQGIEVPERILKDGVKALEEQRFVYKPPTDGLGVKLARAYVNRGRWLPQSLAAGGGLGAIALGFYVFWAMPQAAEWRKLPVELAQLSERGQLLAVDPAVDQRIIGIQHAGERAIEDGKRGEAKAQIAVLKDIDAQLASEYDVRIVYENGQQSGFYRIPNNNRAGRNYYLVVRAISPGGRALSVPITNEETQKTERVSQWAQRVSRDEFDKIRAEKAESQIITEPVIGHKARGDLQPKYGVDTPGGAITDWGQRKK